MKKAIRWTSKSQYAAPRDKQHDQSIGAFKYRQISRFIGLFLWMENIDFLNDSAKWDKLTHKASGLIQD